MPAWLRLQLAYLSVYPRAIHCIRVFVLIFFHKQDLIANNVHLVISCSNLIPIFFSISSRKKRAFPSRMAQLNRRCQSEVIHCWPIHWKNLLLLLLLIVKWGTPPLLHHRSFFFYFVLFAAHRKKVFISRGRRKKIFLHRSGPRARALEEKNLFRVTSTERVVFFFLSFDASSADEERGKGAGVELVKTREKKNFLRSLFTALHRFTFCRREKGLCTLRRKGLLVLIWISFWFEVESQKAIKGLVRIFGMFWFKRNKKNQLLLDKGMRKCLASNAFIALF